MCTCSKGQIEKQVAVAVAAIHYPYLLVGDARTQAKPHLKPDINSCCTVNLAIRDLQPGNPNGMRDFPSPFETARGFQVGRISESVAGCYGDRDAKAPGSARSR